MEDVELDLEYGYDSPNMDCELEDKEDGPKESDETSDVDSDAISSDETESVESEAIESEPCISMSEFAYVYFDVVISSTSGVRKDTFFWAGNLGLADILRGVARGNGPLDSIEFSAWDIEYGIVAEWTVEADDIDEELGVLDSWNSGVSGESSDSDCTELSIESFGLAGLAASVAAVFCGS